MKSAFVLAIIATIGTVCNAESCIPKFKNFATFQTIGEACRKQLIQKGVNITAIPNNPAELEKKHFDDKGAANCTLTEMKFIVNNTFKKEAVIELVKQNAPSDKVEKLVKIVQDCSAESFEKEMGKDEKKAGIMSTMKPATATAMPKANNNDNKKDHHKKMNGTEKGHHGHHNFHHHKIAKQAAKFMHCFSQKEQSVC